MFSRRLVVLQALNDWVNLLDSWYSEAAVIQGGGVRGRRSVFVGDVWLVVGVRRTLPSASVARL